MPTPDHNFSWTLEELADGCLAGACNSYAIVQDLASALRECPGTSGVHTAAYKVVLGHLSFLAGESLGPSKEALDAYREGAEKT